MNLKLRVNTRAKCDWENCENLSVLQIVPLGSSRFIQISKYRCEKDLKKGFKDYEQDQIWTYWLDKKDQDYNKKKETQKQIDKMKSIFNKNKANQDKQTIKKLIIALDPSTANVGWCIIADGHPIVDKDNYPSFGIVLLGSTGDSFSERVTKNLAKLQELENDIFRWIQQLTNIYKIDNVVIGVETPYIRKGNTEVGRKLNVFSGIVTQIIHTIIIDTRLQMGWPKIDVELVCPSTWQNYFGIRENSKGISIELAKKTFGFDIKDDNIADALNLGDYLNNVWKVRI